MKSVILVLMVISSLMVKSQDNFIIEGKGLVGVVELGMSKEEVVAVLGKTDKCELITRKVNITWSDGVTKDSKCKQRKKVKNIHCNNAYGLRIIFEKGNVNKIILSTDKYHTSGGIKVGSTREEVLKIYGGKSDAVRLWYDKLGIAFHFDNKEKVVGIEILNVQ